MEGVCDNEDAALQNLTYAQQMLPITNPTSRNSPHPINHNTVNAPGVGFHSCARQGTAVQTLCGLTRLDAHKYIRSKTYTHRDPLYCNVNLFTYPNP